MKIEALLASSTKAEMDLRKETEIETLRNVE